MPRSASPAAAARGLLLVFGVFGVLWGAWSAIVPAVQIKTGASDGQLGMALFLVAAGAIPGMLVTGPLADRFGRRAMAATMLLFALGGAVVGMAGSVPALAGGLLLLGAGSGALDVAMNAGVAEWEAEHEGRLMNKAHAMFPLGVIGASLAAGLARDRGLGPEPIMLAVAALVIAPALAHLRGGAPAARARAAGAGASEPARRFILSRFLLLVGGVGALAYLVESALLAWSAVHLERTLLAGPFVGSLGPGLFSAAMFVGRAVGQRHGGRISPAAMLRAAGVGAAAGIVIAASAPGPALALAGFALSGASLAVAIPTLFEVAGGSARAGERGASISTATSVAYGGLLIGPPVVGAIASGAGLRAGLGALAVVALLLVFAPLAMRGTPLTRRAGAPA